MLYSYLGFNKDINQMANRNWASAGKIYSMHVKPVLLDCNFIVDSANGNGLGIRSLKGPAIQNVFMHTSASPGYGNSNPSSPNVKVLNPNPASGTIVVQFQDNYNRVLSGCNSIVSPLGSSVSSVSFGVAYVVTSLGTATSAQWLAAGVPSGVLASHGGLPTVGTAFIAAMSGSIGGSAMAAPTAAAGSGVFSIETVGDSNQSIAPSLSAAQGFGAQIILQCRNAASGGTSEIAAPADGSVISLQFLLSDSSILVQGE